MTYRSLFELRGRTIVITGGAGLLGQAYADALTDFGAIVYLLDLLAPAGNGPLAHKIQSGQVRPIQCDIRSAEQLRQALAVMRKEAAGAFSGIVNNAAIDSPPGASAEENGPFEDYPEDSLERVLSVNLKAAFLVCQVFGAELAAGGGGSIVNIGSIYGLVSPVQRIYEYKREDSGKPWFKPAPYGMSKAGLLNLTRYLATYWANQGVRVNMLTPSGVFNSQDARFLEGYLDRIPIGRMAEPTDYCGAMIFLMSDASRYMTGANLVVDGGWTAW